MEVRCDEREACEKYDTIVVTKIEQQRKKKKKYTMALTQPKGVRNVGEYGREVRRVGGARGKCDTIVWAEI